MLSKVLTKLSLISCGSVSTLLANLHGSSICILIEYRTCRSRWQECTDELTTRGALNNLSLFDPELSRDNIISNKRYIPTVWFPLFGRASDVQIAPPGRAGIIAYVSASDCVPI